MLPHANMDRLLVTHKEISNNTIYWKPELLTSVEEALICLGIWTTKQISAEILIKRSRWIISSSWLRYYAIYVPFYWPSFTNTNISPMNLQLKQCLIESQRRKSVWWRHYSSFGPRCALRLAYSKFCLVPCLDDFIKLYVVLHINASLQGTDYSW